MNLTPLAVALALFAVPAVAGDAPRARSAQAEPAPSVDVARDPCPGGMPYEVVYTVAPPIVSLRAVPPLSFTELLPNRTDAVARRRAVVLEGLDLEPDPGNGWELFYPPHRILAIELRPIC